MGAALNDTGRGYQSQAGLLLQLRNAQGTAVAHGRTDLAQGNAHIVLQAAGIRHVGVNALLEGQLLGTAQVITLPVAGTIGALAPILLVVGAINLLPDIIRLDDSLVHEISVCRREGTRLWEH